MCAFSQIGVTGHLSDKVKPVVSTISPSFMFLSERSGAYSHKDTSKCFRFFPVRDITLRFISLNILFSLPIGQIYPIIVETLLRVHDLSYSNFSAAEDFFSEVLSKKFHFSGFLHSFFLPFGPPIEPKQATIELDRSKI